MILLRCIKCTKLWYIGTALCRNLVTIFGINDVSQLSAFYQTLKFSNARKTDTLLSAPKQSCVHRYLSMGEYLVRGGCKLRPSQPNLAFDFSQTSVYPPKAPIC